MRPDNAGMKIDHPITIQLKVNVREIIAFFLQTFVFVHIDSTFNYRFIRHCAVILERDYQIPNNNLPSFT